MLHCMSGIEGGGEDTVAWVSWPPPQTFVFENHKNFSYVSKKCSDIFESNCFLTRLLYFIGRSYIEGGGQYTVAWVSWPPLSFTILK